MNEYYDYDNSQFINSLKDKGFFIASESKTKSPDTPRCMAQVLNMEYLDDDPWSDATYRKLAYSKAAEFLKAQGYQYIVSGSDAAVGRWDSYMQDSADLYFNYFVTGAGRWVSEFQQILWSTTMLQPFYYRLVGTQYRNAYRCQILYTLEHLKRIPEMGGPKFVFAHIVCPHGPYVFGPRGEDVPMKDWFNVGAKEFYLGQYVFISTEIEKAVDALLNKSEIPPIIILQSDHGARPYLPVGGEDWHKILNAMYLPGLDYNTLSDNMSPVNTFRLIFNHYFGADYPLLEND